MASSSKRARVETIDPEEDVAFDYEGDSDNEGMSSGEESELDHLLANEDENESDEEFTPFSDESIEVQERDFEASDDRAGVAGPPVPPPPPPPAALPDPALAVPAAAQRPIHTAAFCGAAAAGCDPCVQPAPLAPAVASDGGGGRHQERGVGRRPARKRRQGGGQVAAPDDDNDFPSYDDPDQGNQLPLFHPHRPTGVHIGRAVLRNTMTRAVDFFRLFFTVEMIKQIVTHTNAYAYERIIEETHQWYAQKDGSWEEVTPDEIERLIALLIYFGLVRVGFSVERYWSKKSLYHGLWARGILKRTRYKALMAMLQVVDPAMETPGDKLRNVNSFIEYFKSRCLSLYQPRQNVAIDERMVRSRHRAGIKQYIRDKPTKWGIKLWVLADSSNGYTIDFNVYIGRAAGRKVSANGLGYDVVMKLMDPFFNQGYHLYVDNFYTSVTLFKDLFDRGVAATGTILENRRDFPVNLKNSKQWAKEKDRGSLRWERDPPCLALQWLDNKVVSVITTIDNANVKSQVSRKVKTARGAWRSVQVPRPEVIAHYNAFMNAVDRSDQLIGTQNVLRKSVKWWKALFFHLIDMAVVNSFILFKEHQAQFPDEPALKRTADYSLTHFREEIVRQLCGFPEYDHPPLHATAKPARPPPDHGLYVTEHIPAFAEERKMCVVCWKREKKNFKVHTCCKAPQCKRHMHITREKNCFEVFHSKDFDH
ncbi:hypothetical protein ACROYT_G039398 [Oculina patagonica]